MPFREGSNRTKGAYDSVVAKLKTITEADLVAVFIVNGKLGSSYTCQTSDASLMAYLKEQLLHAAKEIEKSLEERKKEMH